MKNFYALIAAAAVTLSASAATPRHSVVRADLDQMNSFKAVSNIQKFNNLNVSSLDARKPISNEVARKANGRADDATKPLPEISQMNYFMYLFDGTTPEWLNDVVTVEPSWDGESYDIVGLWNCLMYPSSPYSIQNVPFTWKSYNVQDESGNVTTVDLPTLTIPGKGQIDAGFQLNGETTKYYFYGYYEDEDGEYVPTLYVDDIDLVYIESAKTFQIPYADCGIACLTESGYGILALNPLMGAPNGKVTGTELTFGNDGYIYEDGPYEGTVYGSVGANELMIFGFYESPQLLVFDVNNGNCTADGSTMVWDEYNANYGGKFYYYALENEESEDFSDILHGKLEVTGSSTATFTCTDLAWITLNELYYGFFLETPVIEFDFDGFLGVDKVAVDNNVNAPVEFFNLQGVRVVEPAAGNVYIRRQGNEVSKIIVR